jgi:hypothetical protein
MARRWMRFEMREVLFGTLRSAAATRRPCGLAAPTAVPMTSSCPRRCPESIPDAWLFPRGPSGSRGSEHLR